jgi:hypothetical protein
MGLFTDDDGDFHLGRTALSLCVGAALVYGAIQVPNRWVYADGARVGVINKFSKKGAICKTWEAEMALEGIVSSGGQSGANVWQFSVDNYQSDKEQNDIIAKLNEAMNSQRKVKINYKEMMMTGPCRSDTDHLVQSVEYLQK